MASFFLITSLRPLHGRRGGAGRFTLILARLPPRPGRSLGLPLSSVLEGNLSVANEEVQRLTRENEHLATMWDSVCVQRQHGTTMVKTLEDDVLIAIPCLKNLIIFLT